MKKGVLLALLAIGLVSVVRSSVTVSSYLSSDDLSQMKSLFTAASPYKDAISAYWSLRGLALTNNLPKDTKATCDTLKALSADSAESLFCLTEAAKLVKCTITKTAAQEGILKTAVAAKKINSIYFAYTAMKNLKIAVDDKAVNAALETAMNTDESPTSMAYGFLLASALKLDVEKRYQLIEDVFAQADIVDGTYMQFEGGIYTTALVVEGSYALATLAKKAPTLKPDQVLQLANYLLSRRHVSKLRSTCQLLVALQTLANNQFHIPVAMSLDKPTAVSSASPKVMIRVSNVLGGSVGKTSLTADSGRHIADDAVVLSKKLLTASKSDESLFELDFTNVKAPFGFYRIMLTATPAKPNAKLVGMKGSVELKVITSVKLDSVEVGVADADQSTAPKTSRVAHPNKADGKLEADYHQKLVMSFYAKSVSTSESLKPHQAFVRLSHRATGQEIVFVAEPDDVTKQYKFELDVGAKEKEFGSLSGEYDMALLVGDAVIDNPIDWTLAEVKLTFLNKPSADAASADQYQPKPTIDHMFRQPEKRPPTVVSNVFTALCLLPFLIMLVLWIKLGANISNFPVSIYSLGFHIGLMGIFGLYFMYWTHLNMFETIKYLGILAVPTFLCGNRLLSSIAAKRKAK